VIRVIAAARLHFGLMHPAPDDAAPRPWTDREGRPTLPARRFGGVGLMIESPALQLRVEPAEAWSAEGPRAERALSFAKQFAASVPDAARPQRIVIESAPPEHAGLGSGTQLGLAVARALSAAWHLPGVRAVELGKRVGRGLRSGIGVHGFEQGGFLIDAGKGERDTVAPLLVRRDFPEAWRVLLVTPPSSPGMHGGRERQCFRELSPGAAELCRTDALCRLTLLGLLPALDAGDLDGFGEALFDFNARAGEVFAAAQGGVYSSRAVADAVRFLRGQGVRGVGQSSWGPAVFAVMEADRAEAMARLVRQRFGVENVLVTCGCNRGACAEAVGP
jgi:beta-ribofuranosylaminobenzene 5'-phosphate synthase